MPFIVFNDGTNSGGGGGGVTTLNNGLTLTGSNGQLGGNLVQSTNIRLAGFVLDVAGNTATELTLDDSTGDTSLYGGNTTLNSLLLQDATASFTRANGIGHLQKLILADNLGVQVEDTYAHIGLIGTADYSANYTAHSYVQQSWVLSQISGAGGFVGLNKVAGASSNENLINYIIPESTTSQFIITCAGCGRGGTGSAVINVSYTDTAGNPQSFTLIPGISPGVDFSGQSTSIFVFANSTIIISLVVSGTIFVDIASALQFIQ